MQVIITGMKRQIVDDNKSVSSRVEDLPNEGIDFFEDDSDIWYNQLEYNFKYNKKEKI